MINVAGATEARMRNLLMSLRSIFVSAYLLHLIHFSSHHYVHHIDRFTFLLVIESRLSRPRNSIHFLRSNTTWMQTHKKTIVC